MKTTRKVLAIWGLLLFALSAAFAQEATIPQEATIRELAGTVELQRAGTQAWENAAQGQAVLPDTVISTGFRSYALLGIGDSLINVRPLTRLAVKELSSGGETETLNASLNAGRVKADINPPPGTRASVTIQAPMAVSSVRGTSFEMGLLELWVMEGSVEYKGISGPPVIIDSGGYSYINEKTRWAVPPIESLRAVLDPDLPIAYDNFNSFEGAYGKNAAQNINLPGSSGSLTGPVTYR